MSKMTLEEKLTQHFCKENNPNKINGLKLGRVVEDITQQSDQLKNTTKTAAVQKQLRLYIREIITSKDTSSTFDDLNNLLANKLEDERVLQEIISQNISNIQNDTGIEATETVNSSAYAFLNAVFNAGHQGTEIHGTLCRIYLGGQGNNTLYLCVGSTTIELGMDTKNKKLGEKRRDIFTKKFTALSEREDIITLIPSEETATEKPINPGGQGNVTEPEKVAELNNEVEVEVEVEVEGEAPEAEELQAAKEKKEKTSPIAQEITALLTENGIEDTHIQIGVVHIINKGDGEYALFIGDRSNRGIGTENLNLEELKTLLNGEDAIEYLKKHVGFYKDNKELITSLRNTHRVSTMFVSNVLEVISIQINNFQLEINPSGTIKACKRITNGSSSFIEPTTEILNEIKKAIDEIQEIQRESEQCVQQISQAIEDNHFTVEYNGEKITYQYANNNTDIRLNVMDDNGNTSGTDNRGGKNAFYTQDEYRFLQSIVKKVQNGNNEISVTTLVNESQKTMVFDSESHKWVLPKTEEDGTKGSVNTISTNNTITYEVITIPQKMLQDEEKMAALKHRIVGIFGSYTISIPLAHITFPGSSRGTIKTTQYGILTARFSIEDSGHITFQISKPERSAKSDDELETILKEPITAPIVDIRNWITENS